MSRSMRSSYWMEMGLIVSRSPAVAGGAVRYIESDGSFRPTGCAEGCMTCAKAETKPFLVIEGAYYLPDTTPVTRESLIKDANNAFFRGQLTGVWTWPPDYAGPRTTPAQEFAGKPQHDLDAERRNLQAAVERYKDDVECTRRVLKEVRDALGTAEGRDIIAHAKTVVANNVEWSRFAADLNDEASGLRHQLTEETAKRISAENSLGEANAYIRRLTGNTERFLTPENGQMWFNILKDVKIALGLGMDENFGAMPAAIRELQRRNDTQAAFQKRIADVLRCSPILERIEGVAREVRFLADRYQESSFVGKNR